MMKWNCIKELAKETHNGTQHQNNAKHVMNTGSRKAWRCQNLSLGDTIFYQILVDVQ